MDQLGYDRSWTHLIQILRVYSVQGLATYPKPSSLALRRDTNLHEQARGSTSTNPGALSLLHVFALAPTDRGCYGKTCINTIWPQHRWWVVYPGAPPAHTLMALFHAVVPGEAICPAGCIWLALMYMHEMLKENAKKRRTRVKRLSTTPCSEPQVAEELKTYYVSHNS